MLNKDAPTPDGEFVHPTESLCRLIMNKVNTIALIVLSYVCKNG